MYSFVVASQHATLTRPYTDGEHIDAKSALQVRPERLRSVFRLLPECSRLFPTRIPIPPRPPVMAVTRRVDWMHSFDWCREIMKPLRNGARVYVGSRVQRWRASCLVRLTSLSALEQSPSNVAFPSPWFTTTTFLNNFDLPCIADNDVPTVLKMLLDWVALIMSISLLKSISPCEVDFEEYFHST